MSSVNEKHLALLLHTLPLSSLGLLIPLLLVGVELERTSWCRRARRASPARRSMVCVACAFEAGLRVFGVVRRQ